MIETVHVNLITIATFYNLSKQIPAVNNKVRVINKQPEAFSILFL